MDASFDILGLGCVAVDDFLYVDGYPPADSKTPVMERRRECGGLTATALVAAARLGARCAYAGVLGEDELSRFATDAMARAGVDMTHLIRRAGARPIHATVVVDRAAKTRAIFFDLHDVHGPDADTPPADLIRSARLLLVDMLSVPGMIRAARIAREAGRPVVADFERESAPDFPELLALVDHLILSQAFAAQITGHSDPRAAAAALWSDARAAVVITCGSEGCWYLTNGAGKPVHQPAFPVDAVDTTGCGDVFHGAYAAALVRGSDLRDCIRFASATAALKAARPGGQSGIPTRDAVERFLKESHR